MSAREPQCPWDIEWCGGDCGDCSGPAKGVYTRIIARCKKCGWKGHRTIWMRQANIHEAIAQYCDKAVLGKRCPKCGEKVIVWRIIGRRKSKS